MLLLEEVEETRNGMLDLAGPDPNRSSAEGHLKKSGSFKCRLSTKFAKFENGTVAR